MPIEADKTYKVTCVSARMITSPVKGTPGLYVELKCDHGIIDHTLWCTAANRDSVERSLVNMGLEPHTLQTKEFWVDPGPSSFLVGRTCGITTEEENGGVRVKWINSAGGKPASKTDAERAMCLFTDNDGFGAPMETDPPF